MSLLPPGAPPKKKPPMAVLRLLNPDLDTSLNDCDSCGLEGTVTLVPNFNYVNDKYKLNLTLPAYVCNDCGNSVFETSVFILIQEAIEAAKGRPYLKVEVKDGVVTKYAIN